MNNLNLTKKNFNPFENKIFNDPTNLFPDLLKITPTIPSIYFNPVSSGSGSLFLSAITGSTTTAITTPTNNNKIIDTYFKISLLFEKLENIKKIILFILNTSKDDLKKIKFSMSSYNLSMKNLLINFTEDSNGDFKKNFEKQSDFINFINLFVQQNNFKIFKDTESLQKSLKFFYIFQNTYTGNSHSKKYFLSLFKLYINTRIELIELLNANYGILAFYFFFTIKDDKNKVNNKKKSENEANGTINYNKYIFLSDAVNLNNNGNKNNSASKIKYNLDTKVNHFDKLYSLNFYNNNSFKVGHKNNMNTLFKNFHDSLMFLVGNKSKNNLFNVCYYDIETDFYLLKFLFSYVSVELFNKCVDLNFKIKSKIYKSINIFDVYYEQYISWWKQLTRNNRENNSESENVVVEQENFDDFLQKQLGNIFNN